MAERTAQAVKKYIEDHPEQHIDVWRMRSSSGVMTLFEVGPYRVRWDRISTSAFRKYLKKNDADKLRAHILKCFAEFGDDLYYGDIHIVDEVKRTC